MIAEEKRNSGGKKAYTFFAKEKSARGRARARERKKCEQFNNKQKIYVSKA